MNCMIDCALNIEYLDNNVIKMIGKHIIAFYGHFTWVALKLESLEFELWKWKK